MRRFPFIFLILWALNIEALDGYQEFLSFQRHVSEGKKYEMGQQWEKALESYSQALAIAEQHQNGDLVKFEYSTPEGNWVCCEMSYGDLVFHRAIVHYKMGNFEASLSDLIAAAKLGDSSAQAALWARGMLW